MKKQFLRLIALVLAAVMLTGCSILEDYQRPKDAYLGRSSTTFADMEYERPDPEDVMQYQRQCIALAEEGKDLDALTEAIWGFYTEYDRFYTLYTLADIHYCIDMSDLYWSDEYDWCVEKINEVDAGFDQLMYALAASPLRQALESEDLFGAGYFDGYEGESIWDETLTAMMEEESALIGRYEELSMALPEDDDPGYEAAAMEIVDLYAELIALRQEQAAYLGYDNYVNCANDLYYGRDYTPAQEAAYVAQVKEKLVPLYRRVCQMSNEELGYYRATEEQVFWYLEMAGENMGGTVAEAFEIMEGYELYDISAGANKYPASFEVYIWDYDLPFVFLNPEGSNYDALSFAHEFGHFCNDYASYGTMLNVDCGEVLSQGMEYLTLCYTKGTEEMVPMKMADSLCTYVEQSAYAAFEQAAYSLTGADLTAENLVKLYEDVTLEFGFDAWGEYDGTELAELTHLFGYPCYVFSYVVSNDAAMQIYQLELEKQGAGLRVYERCLTSDAWDLTQFVEEAGLESPFAEGRLDDVAAIFEEVFPS